MKIQVSRIKNAFLRRTAMVLLFPVLAILAPCLGLLRGGIELIILLETLVRSWGPAWRGEPFIAAAGAEVGIINHKLALHISVDVLAWAAEHMPSGPPIKVLDNHAFAKAVGRAMMSERDEHGTTLIHEMFDEAFVDVVEMGDDSVEV